jgi:hypothetical protein
MFGRQQQITGDGFISFNNNKARLNFNYLRERLGAATPSACFFARVHECNDNGTLTVKKLGGPYPGDDQHFPTPVDDTIYSCISGSDYARPGWWGIAFKLNEEMSPEYYFLPIIIFGFVKAPTGEINSLVSGDLAWVQDDPPSVDCEGNENI